MRRGAKNPQVIDDQSAAAWLEAKNRAESDAQIVVRAVVEIDFVAAVEAQADRPEMTLQSSARIEHPVDIVGAEAVDATEESSESGGSGIDTEIDESPFQRDKWLDSVVTDVNFGANSPWRMRILVRANVTEPVLVSVNPSVNAWLKS